MAAIKNILIVLILISLSACSSVPRDLNITSKPAERPVLVLPNVDEFNARELEWITITPDNINNVFADLQDENKQVVLIAITPEGMQNLTLNMADLLKLVQQQKQIIAAYKKYYEETQP
jgi:hypothetical protein